MIFLWESTSLIDPENFDMTWGQATGQMETLEKIRGILI